MLGPSPVKVKPPATVAPVTLFGDTQKRNLQNTGDQGIKKALPSLKFPHESNGGIHLI